MSVASQVLPTTIIRDMSTERVKAENKTKHKKKEDIIILETIREIKDRKKIKANSGRKYYTLCISLCLSY